MFCTGTTTAVASPDKHGPADGKERLHVEEDVDDVAVLDDVLLAFGAEEAALLGFGFAACSHKVVEADDFGADEATAQVAVDFAGGFGRGRAGRDGPGAAFIGAGGEEADEAEELVAHADGAGHAALRDAGGFAEFGGFVVAELVQLHFELAAEDGNVPAGALIFAAEFGFDLAAARKVVVSDIHDDEQRKGGEELHAFEVLPVVGAKPLFAH